jgi:hypothetical protein
LEESKLKNKLGKKTFTVSTILLLLFASFVFLQNTPIVQAYVIPSTKNNHVVDAVTGFIAFSGTQRVVFDAAGRHWIFYADGQSLYYTSSINSSSIAWVTPTLMHTFTQVLNVSGDYSFYYDQFRLYHAFTDGNIIYFRSGVFNSDGTLTWETEPQVVVDWSAYTRVSGVSITASNSSLIWIGYWNYYITYLYSSRFSLGSYLNGTYTLINDGPLHVGDVYPPTISLLRCGLDNVVCVFSHDNYIGYTSILGIELVDGVPVYSTAIQNDTIVDDLAGPGPSGGPIGPWVTIAIMGSFTATYSPIDDKVVVVYMKRWSADALAQYTYNAIVYDVTNTDENAGWSAFLGAGYHYSVGLGDLSIPPFMPYPHSTTISVDSESGAVFFFHGVNTIRYDVFFLANVSQPVYDVYLWSSETSINVCASLQSDGIIGVVFESRPNQYLPQRELDYFAITDVGDTADLPPLGPSPSPTPTPTATPTPSSTPIIIISSGGNQYYFRSDEYTTNTVLAYGFDSDFTNDYIIVKDPVTGGP